MPTTRRRAAAALAAVVAAVAGACGGSSGTGVTALEPGAAVDATVEVAMAEFTYTPGTATVPSGRAVRFRFTNRGQVPHEARVGTAAEHESYEDDRAGDAADMPAVQVQPGGTGDLVVRFSEPGTYVLGCHELGHWAAGQKATVTVT